MQHLKPIPHPIMGQLQGPMVVYIPVEDIPYIYFTSDLHFWHKNILKFTSRGQAFRYPDPSKLSDIEFMNEILLSNINTIITDNLPKTDANGYTPKIRLFHCGDLIFGTKGQVVTRLDYIQSKMSEYADMVYGVMGNHDTYNIFKFYSLESSMNMNNIDIIKHPKWFWNNMYIVHLTRDGSIVSTFTVSHFPMPEYHGYFNIHGHLHSEPTINPNSNANDEILKYRSTGRHFDCGVDNNQYCPVSLQTILEGKTSIKISDIPQLACLKFPFMQQEIPSE